MNYLQRIKCYFYSEELKRSDMQLAQDFGEFPPFPLNCNGLDCEFIVVRTRGIGGIAVRCQLFKRILQVKNKDEVHPSLHEILQTVQAVRSQITTLRLDLSNSVSTTGKRILFALALFPLLLLAAVAIAPWVIFNAAKLLIKAYRNVPGSAAYFLPLFAGESRIMIKADVLAKLKDGDSIIAHEHIHLLQNRNGSQDNKKSNCRDILLDEESKDDAHTLYTLQKHEIEARLHEIALSYYRVQKALPLTLDGFIAMLAGSQCFGELVIDAMEVEGAPSTKGAVQYYERSKSIALEVGWILLSIRNLELRRRFICEVLPVMYANLIQYYGDEDSSRLLLQKLSRPNLHDELYGH